MREKLQGLRQSLQHILERLTMWLVLAMFIVIGTHLIYHSTTFPVSLSYLVIFGLVSLSLRALEIGHSILPERIYNNIWIKSLLAGILYELLWLPTSRFLNLNIVLFVWKGEFTFAQLCALAFIFSLLLLLNYSPKKRANIEYTRN